MNRDYEKRLETEIDRELKRLPDLAAPPTVISRVLRVLEQRVQLPWYRRPWATWPFTLQVAALLFLAGLFAGLCLVAGMVPQTPEYVAATNRASGWLAFINMLGNTVLVVLEALVLTIKRLGTGFIVGCLASLALGYVMTVGLGTLYFRIGLARRATH